MTQGPPAAERRPRRAETTAARLRQEIAAGRFEAAQVLPGERALAELLQVSRTTLRQALATLTAEGLLSQRQGLGTVILRAPQETGPSTAPQSDFYTIGINRPVSDHRELTRGLVVPNGEEALGLAIPSREVVYRMSRLILRDGVPAGIEHQTTRRCFLPDPPPAGRSILEALVHEGFRPARYLRRFQGVRTTPAEADALGLEPGISTIGLQDAAYLADGRCCLLVRALYRADRMDLMFDADSPPEAHNARPGGRS